MNAVNRENMYVQDNVKVRFVRGGLLWEYLLLLKCAQGKTRGAENMEVHNYEKQ